MFCIRRQLGRTLFRIIFLLFYAEDYQEQSNLPTSVENAISTEPWRHFYKMEDIQSKSNVTSTSKLLNIIISRCSVVERITIGFALCEHKRNYINTLMRSSYDDVVNVAV